ncbi:hypothetical protein PF005_g10680 [Phytophthora fragariae]|uniref:Uncharacterized protein n=2 Tax=Phytophthora TaxID=4783 RepID=A0A6A3ZNT9_9STRA|nr:hypothetical protein PR001_g29374 [Phytophthora rubi]KAE9012373.1 hypothetical protein PF011_g8934 [Phytophthora fragariae]KAE9004858.1 hypothetical protein PR002_g16937 [Phytophthora rubi]KAE9170354.1 hypothetical protein PF004_g27903 [Phytophthora fragariae]KAE9212206.1 hypothetical protein PF005_g10680 [Phytophthora fragariae]
MGKEQRRASEKIDVLLELAHRLENRPDVQELRDLAIVHDADGVPPSLQATQEKL